MLRLALMLCLSVFAVLPCASTASAKDVWGLAQTTSIDQRKAGTLTVRIGETRGKIKALRLSTLGAPVTLLRVTVKPVDATQVVKGGPVKLVSAQSPVDVYAAPAEQVIDSLTLVWDENPAATGPVQIRIEALQSPEALASRPADRPADGAVTGGPKRTGSPRSLQSNEETARESSIPKSTEALPPPKAAQPSTRGIISAPPSTGAPAPAPRAAAPVPPPPTASGPRPRSLDRESTIGAPMPAPSPPPAPSASAPAGGAAEPGSVCVSDGVCTPVPVFFGSSRDQVKGQTHISFGYDRPNKLTLGRTIVTVPKARKQGEIPRPSTLDWVRGVPAEGLADRHFTIPKDGVKVYESEAAFIAEAKKYMSEAGDSRDHAFIYVHGFAVNFENAMYRAAQITYDLGTGGKPFGTAFVYTWPSQGSIFPTAYNYDADSVDVSISHFRKFVEIVAQKTKVKHLHVIAHSMGNRIVMRALDEAVKTGAPSWISQVILAAPDVDKQVFEQLAANLASSARGLTLYASQQDNALKISRVFRGNRAPPRAGEVAPPAGPAVVNGIDTIDISSLSTSYFLPDLDSHDKYADSPEMLSDIGAIFTKSKPAPESRNSNFRKATFQTLEYWRYAK
ncbi:MAG: alpha/beta hydrolase [Hyphomicrobium aestuarii]|nr:alpha/beta hydrolase [Hyphomicrobium aestuarii]